MSKRRTAEQIVRLLREADRDLAKGLTVADVCRKVGIAPNTYYRGRQAHDPAPGALRARPSAAGSASLRTPITAGGRNTTRPRSMTPAASARSKARSSA